MCFGSLKRGVRADVIMDQGAPDSSSIARPASDRKPEGSNSDGENYSPNRIATSPVHTTTPSSPAPTPRSKSSVSEPKSSLIHRDDWAIDLPDTEHIRFFRETNWAATRLGPLSTWGIALRLHVLTVMADSLAGCIYW